MRSKVYKDINFMRLFACTSVLLYHLNILKGGYLAVCIFLVLSGYLSCISAFKKDKFSFLQYYKNKLKKLYLPLVIVVFITVAITSLFKDVIWLNLKPETTSVLLGYNNFWQLNANLDYFAQHVSSPFMHLWYIGILLQFDLVFPFVYLFFHKLGDKLHKVVPCILVTFLALISTLYFYNMSFVQEMMITYYHTLTRIFSLLLGVSLGFIHSYYKSIAFSSAKHKVINRIVFFSYTLILTYFMIFIDATSNYYSLAMIITSLITCRLIDYSVCNTSQKMTKSDKIIKSFSDISYEIYLVQYPIIFLFQYINIQLEVPIIIVLTIVISYILHFCINLKNKKGIIKSIGVTGLMIILSVTIYGGYKYYLSEDHTEEMKALEKQLAENEKLLEEKQKAYEQQLKQEQLNWFSTLKDLEDGEKNLESTITNLNIVGIGDSIMLGALPNLYKQFPNGYFDAKTSRTAWVVNDILKSLKNKNILGNPIVLNLGSNGDCTDSCKEEIMKTCDGKEIFWVNVSNDSIINFNDKLEQFSSKHENIHIIDWNSISKGHNEYFIADGIHLTEMGKEAYIKAIYDEIYKVYLQDFNDKKQELMDSYEQRKKSKISLYGNDILLNAFSHIEEDFTDAKFNINENYTYSMIKNELESAINNEELNYKVILAFDKTIKFSEEEYKELTQLLKDYKIYYLITSEEMIDIIEQNKSINLITLNFYEEYIGQEAIFMADKIHLTEKGNIELGNMLKKIIYTD